MKRIRMLVTRTGFFKDAHDEVGDRVEGEEYEVSDDEARARVSMAEAEVIGESQASLFGTQTEQRDAPPPEDASDPAAPKKSGK